MRSYIAAFVCVLGLAVGQLLFKQCAASLNGSALNFKALVFFVSAISIYAVASIAWVLILKNEELGSIYPLMALGFVLVPFGSHLFFGEQFHAQYFVGIILIIGGIVVSTSA